MLKKALIILGFLSFGLFGNDYGGYIQQIQFWPVTCGDHFIKVYTTDNPTTPFYVRRSNYTGYPEEYKQIHAQLLAAQAGGRRVLIGANPPNYEIYYVTVY